MSQWETLLMNGRERAAKRLGDSDASGHSSALPRGRCAERAAADKLIQMPTSPSIFAAP
jgi:hypothetical protein